MNSTLPSDLVKKVTAQLRPALASTAVHYPGERPERQPIHTVYGGAHLFSSETTSKLGVIAAKSLASFAPDSGSFSSIFGLSSALGEIVYARVREKLAKEAVEDLRIDFEDGYGIRTDAEEDGHAVTTANETSNAMAAGKLPPFFGIRIKSFSLETLDRSIRTLDLYLTALSRNTDAILPDNFVVTLPKIVSSEQVAALADILDEIEARLSLRTDTIKVEIMIETVQSIIAPDGRTALPGLIAASRGRCRGAHFGAFDYTADCGITAPYQDLRHPSCDLARQIMQVSLTKTGVALSDGVTTVMPIAPHRGEVLSPEQIAENESVVRSAWRLHYDNCRWALQNGFYQGWDLHPAQIPARYAAVYSFFLEGLDQTSNRLKNFVEKAARVTLTGNDFDDAATGQGLLNYFTRAINCGALTEDEVLKRTGLSAEQLRSGSFASIIEQIKG